MGTARGEKRNSLLDKPDVGATRLGRMTQRLKGEEEAEAEEKGDEE